jgi:hypothetical protein
LNQFLVLLPEDLVLSLHIAIQPSWYKLAGDESRDYETENPPLRPGGEFGLGCEDGQGDDHYSPRLSGLRVVIPEDVWVIARTFWVKFDTFEY